MGAGKITVGPTVAARIGRPFVDLDDEIEAEAGASIPAIFAERGESGFRALEEAVAARVLASGEPAVVALGGGAVLSEGTRGLLARRAFTVLLDVEPDVAWRRVAAGDRPLAVGRGAVPGAVPRAGAGLRGGRRRPGAQDVDGVLLAAAGVHVEVGAMDQLGELVPGSGPVEIVVDARVDGIHGVRAQVALGTRDVATHEVPAGEPAKSAQVLERLWRSFTVGRDGSIVALGGGTTTDLGGFAAATYKRGVDVGRRCRRR